MSYLAKDLPYFISVAARQRPKDQLFVDQILPFFRPGRLLEIGAGCGQLSSLLQRHGFDVIASDIEQFFVDYQRKCGLQSTLVDATTISDSLDEPVDNVLAQGVSTLVTHDLGMVRKTYESIWNALKPGGRLVFIFPNYKGQKGRWSNPHKDHPRIFQEVGFKLHARFRSQIFPSQWYHALPDSAARFCENTFGKHFGLRVVTVLEK
ncbi:MAG: class I SAM-dependent methyltransferase [Pirellulales bacterium]|nr:class I SAM-dependent methyltransferase [Pirellulales bacterium]